MAGGFFGLLGEAIIVFWWFQPNMETNFYVACIAAAIIVQGLAALLNVVAFAWFMEVMGYHEDGFFNYLFAFFVSAKCRPHLVPL